MKMLIFIIFIIGIYTWIFWTAWQDRNKRQYTDPGDPSCKTPNRRGGEQLLIVMLPALFLFIAISILYLFAPDFTQSLFEVNFLF